MQRNNSLLYLKELMTYTVKNYPSGAALKRDFALGIPITIFQPNAIFPALCTGTVYLEGPHYPQPHKWYLSVQVRNGVVVKINK